MPGRLPTKADLPVGITCSITPPPASKSPVNVLILLHGLGDSHLSFKTFGERLALPETACIALQAPNPMPFDLGGFQWGDDISFDSSTGRLDTDTGFAKATTLILDQVINNLLISTCGFALRDILIFGFAQGGMAALSVASKLSTEKREALGGVIAIGGALPLSTNVTAVGKQSTPVLICKAKKSSAVSTNEIARTRNAFATVEIVDWDKAGDAMPSNQTEVMPIMQFLARRLRSRAGVPAGAIEVT